MAVERLQVALEPTSQSILTEVKSVKADTTNMVPKVNEMKTDIDAIDSKTIAINLNLGQPTDSASNGTSGSAHKKLNWLMQNMVPKSVLKVGGRDADYGSQVNLTNNNGTIYPIPNTNSMTGYLTVYGKGRLLYIQKHSDAWAMGIVIDGKPFGLGAAGVFDIPFSSQLKIEYGGPTAPLLIYYELNE